MNRPVAADALAILDLAAQRIQSIQHALDDLHAQEPQGYEREYVRGAIMGIRQALGQLAELRKEYET